MKSRLSAGRLSFFCSRLNSLCLAARHRYSAIPLPANGLGHPFSGLQFSFSDYGCPFWAEQRAPSGIAAVVLACIPVFMTLLEIVLRTQRLTWRLGMAPHWHSGVAVLMNSSLRSGERPIDRAGTPALIFAAFAGQWWRSLRGAFRCLRRKPRECGAQMLRGSTALRAGCNYRRVQSGPPVWRRFRGTPGWHSPSI